MMLVVGLSIVAIPGLIVNNMQNSGLLAPPQTSCAAGQTLVAGQCMACNNATNTCYLVSNVGCNTTGTNPLGPCSLQGSNLQLFKACSPFTSLIQFNYVGFVNSFFSKCGVQSGQAVTGPGAVANITAQTATISGCTPLDIGPFAPDTVTSLACTSVVPALPLITVSASFNLFAAIGGTACASNWNGVIGNSTVGSIPTATLACFNGYITNGTKLQSVVTFTGQCLTYGDFSGQVGATGNKVTSLSCNSFTGLIPVTQTCVLDCPLLGGGSALSWSSILSFGIFLLGGVLLLFQSLGLGFNLGGQLIASGGQFGVQSNSQGTKQAQVFGVGLLLWGIVYSEWGSWFTSGFLPYGLDGVVGLVSIVTSAIFLFGVFKLSQTPAVAGS